MALKDIRCVELLLRHKADISHPGPSGQSALQEAREMRRLHVDPQRCAEETVRLLEKAEKQVDARSVVSHVLNLVVYVQLQKKQAGKEGCVTQ